MKTAYVISPGIQMPESFVWRNLPMIISQPQLWDAMRSVPSGIVFRVRTEQNVGDRLNGSDRVESAVGLLDSTSRWRACLAIIRMALSGLRNPAINEACWAVFGMMTQKHPASVAMTERQQLANNLRIAMDKMVNDDARVAYESSCGAMCIRLAFAENDVETAHIVPYSPIYMVNGVGHQDDREATIEAMASNVFCAEALGRMYEKLPEWGFAKLPATPTPAPAQPAPRQRPAAGQEVEDDEMGTLDPHDGPDLP